MARPVMAVLWPSFLTAVLAEGCFFSLFDPQDLALWGSEIELPRLAVYTLGFFFFWLFCSLSSLLTYCLSGMPERRRAPPLRHG